MLNFGGKNLPILLKVYTRDNLGNDIENSWNLIYHGDLESPVVGLQIILNLILIIIGLVPILILHVLQEWALY